MWVRAVWLLLLIEKARPQSPTTYRSIAAGRGDAGAGARHPSSLANASPFLGVVQQLREKST
jgi:hypothetical protein